MGIPLKKLAAIILIMMVISCTKEPLKTPGSNAVQSNDNATQKTAGHYIGERFGGGVIFFIGKNGLHGLIADKVDLPWYYTWYNGTYILTGATGMRIGDGPSNTRKIIVGQGNTLNYAALACAKSTRSGYTDWFLPSIDELSTLYKKRHVVGGFTRSGYYWSSSEANANVAWVQSFATGGYRYGEGKYQQYFVRAIRAF